MPLALARSSTASPSTATSSTSTPTPGATRNGSRKRAALLASRSADPSRHRDAQRSGLVMAMPEPNIVTPLRGLPSRAHHHLRRHLSRYEGGSGIGSAG